MKEGKREKRDKNLKRFFHCNFFQKNRRGQVTIFIIIAVIVVAFAVFIYIELPAIKSALGVQQQNPNEFIQSCLEKDIKNSADNLALHGGDFNPTLYSTFNNIKIKDLCYTTLYCDLCGIQEPQLKPHIEQEIKQDIQSKVKDCFNSLQDSYRKQGYEANVKPGDIKVELLPKRIVTTLNYSLAITKTSTQTYDSFSVVLNNNLYELIAITNSILDWETTYGNTDVTLYMDYYPDLKVERKLLGDGTKVYIITDRNTENKFEFASRSMVYAPSGYC